MGQIYHQVLNNKTNPPWYIAKCFVDIFLKSWTVFDKDLQMTNNPKNIYKFQHSHSHTCKLS